MVDENRGNHFPNSFENRMILSCFGKIEEAISSIFSAGACFLIIEEKYAAIL